MTDSARNYSYPANLGGPVLAEECNITTDIVNILGHPVCALIQCVCLVKGQNFIT